MLVFFVWYPWNFLGGFILAWVFKLLTSCSFCRKHKLLGGLSKWPLIIWQQDQESKTRKAIPISAFPIGKFKCFNFLWLQVLWKVFMGNILPASYWGNSPALYRNEWYLGEWLLSGRNSIWSEEKSRMNVEAMQPVSCAKWMLITLEKTIQSTNLQGRILPPLRNSTLRGKESLVYKQNNRCTLQSYRMFL